LAKANRVSKEDAVPLSPRVAKVKHLFHKAGSQFLILTNPNANGSPQQPLKKFWMLPFSEKPSGLRPFGPGSLSLLAYSSIKDMLARRSANPAKMALSGDIHNSSAGCRGFVKKTSRTISMATISSGGRPRRAGGSEKLRFDLFTMRHITETGMKRRSLSDYLGIDAADMLKDAPYNQWPVTRSFAEDPEEPSYHYISPQHGLELRSDDADRISVIFVFSKTCGGFDNSLIDLRFGWGRREVRSHLGLPSKSAEPSRSPILGDSGPWDRF
jgi:hypothetical protein